MNLKTPKKPSKLSKALLTLKQVAVGLSTTKKKRVVKLLQMLTEESDDAQSQYIVDTINEILFPAQTLKNIRLYSIEELEKGKNRNLEYRKQVGNEVKKARSLLGWTQQELAEKAGIPQSHVSRIECGKHASSYITINKLATALNVEPSQIDPGFE